jgi:hypothetical protein
MVGVALARLGTTDVPLRLARPHQTPQHGVVDTRSPHDRSVEMNTVRLTLTPRE